MPSSQRTLSEFSVSDAGDLIVLAVGGAYLQDIVARARLRSAQAQLETADALYQQTLQQRKAEIVAPVDPDHSEVQLSDPEARFGVSTK